jgi:predicted methyltransferase
MKTRNRHRYRNILMVAGVALAACALMPGRAGAQIPPVEAAINETAPLPAAQIPSPISAAVNSSDRPADDKKLDPGRKPDQVMAFFGIQPGMKVADLWAGGGYTTEVLSRIVGPTGTVYSQNGQFPERFKKIGDAWHARLKNPALKNVVEVDKGFDAPDLLPVPPGSLDAVVMNLNYHDMVGLKMNRDQVNAAVFKALKPGGVYGIVDNSAQSGSGARDTTTIHRIDEDFVVKDIEKSGFKLAGASRALRNPKDDRTWLIFKNRDEVDRFILKFVKPS